jgi:hypothetical protein
VPVGKLKGKNKNKKFFFCILKINVERIRGSGSKCHGSPTLPEKINFAGKTA